MHFYFNVSYISRYEKILEAEFHIFKLRPQPPGGGSAIPRGVHLIEVGMTTLELGYIFDTSMSYVKCLRCIHSAAFHRVYTVDHLIRCLKYT